MAAPNFQAAGAVVSGSGAISPAWPTHQINDYALLIVETANQAPSLSPAAGFTQAAQIGTGTAGTSGATMLTIYECRATSSSMSAPTVSDSGDHQTAQIITFRGCITTGSAIGAIATSVQATAQTGFSLPGVTTTVNEALVVLALSNNGLISVNQMTVPRVNANLSNIVERTDTQPVATQVTALKFGPYTGLSNNVGIGPGGDLGQPVYTVAGINPFSMTQAQRQAAVDLADQLDITLFVTTPDVTTSYGSNTATGFNSTAYDANVQKIVDTMPEIADALTRQRAVAVFCDEPYHNKWLNSSNQPTFTPTIVNQKARLHKTKFGSTCITVGRCDLDKMVDGNGATWVNLGIPSPNGYDAVDYFVMQFEGPQAQAHLDFTTALANARADGNTINVGVIPAINLWAGGNHVLTGGVSQCWDYLGTGSSSGVVAGSVQGSPSPYARGENVDCATWNATPTSGKKTLVCSPDWLRHIADTVFNDPDIPWLIFWIYATSGLVDYPWMKVLQGDTGTRTDQIAALDYVLTKCKSRPTFNGLRTIKT